MFGRRKTNSGKGFSSFLTTALLAFLTVIVSQAYPRYQRNAEYTEALNKVRADFSSQKWGPAIEGYKKLWADYPDKNKADQFNVAAAHENWGTELYETSLRTRQKFGTAATQFELSAEQRPLSEQSLLALGDCYIETGQLKKVQSVIREARERKDINGDRFEIFKKRLSQANNATKK
jgi:predicted Zn-dependent protease